MPNSSSQKRDTLKSDSGSPDCHLTELHQMLKKVLASSPSGTGPDRAAIQEDEAEDPKVICRGRAGYAMCAMCASALNFLEIVR